MASLTINFERGDNLAQFAAIYQEEALAGAAVIGEEGVAMVIERSPIDRGFFRNSITNKVEVIALGVVECQVFSQLEPVVVNVIESGRSPGTFAPVEVIRAWVARVIRPPLNMIATIGFLVNRKIKERGIPGKRVFQRAFDALQPIIKREVDGIGARIARRL